MSLGLQVGSARAAPADVQLPHLVHPAFYGGYDWHSSAFERMYGWAWVLKLAEELHRSTSAEAKRWEQHLQPLTDVLVTRYLDFLPKQTYAIRTGVHPNTAFGLGFALDYAIALGHAPLKDIVVARSRDYFLGDTDYPAKLAVFLLTETP